MAWTPEDLERAIAALVAEKDPQEGVSKRAFDLASEIEKLVSQKKLTQRWREEHTLFVPPDEGFRPTKYEVIPITVAQAKGFVLEHHYLGSFASCRLATGLYESGGKLVGVAVFGVPAREAVAHYTSGELSETSGTELNRFVLLDEVPYDAETWFLARAFKMLLEKKPDIQVVISYSDPVPRYSTSGLLVMPGHLGIIYQAFNAAYVGSTKAEGTWLDAEGKSIGARLLSKIRHGEVGQDYGIERLLAAGAPARRRGESAEAWVERSLREGPFRRIRHPGKHTYLWPLGPTKRERKRIASLFPEAIGYPGDPQLKRKAREQRARKYGRS